jgi:hypothetical protein
VQNSGQVDPYIIGEAGRELSVLTGLLELNAVRGYSTSSSFKLDSALVASNGILQPSFATRLALDGHGAERAERARFGDQLAA